MNDIKKTFNSAVQKNFGELPESFDVDFVTYTKSISGKRALNAALYTDFKAVYVDQWATAPTEQDSGIFELDNFLAVTKNGKLVRFSAQEGAVVRVIK